MRKVILDTEKLVQWKNEGVTIKEIASRFGCSEDAVVRRWKEYKDQMQPALEFDFLNSSDAFKLSAEDEEIVKENVKLSKKLQRFADSNRIERKVFREYARIENAIAVYSKKLVDIFSKYDLPGEVKTFTNLEDEAVGVCHVTDPHFNELVELDFNTYDFTEASKRFKKYADKSKLFFKASGVKKVLIAMTGDLLNSDRRLDELLNQATNRASAVFLAVSILEQFILDMAKDFEVSIVNVIGNESRIPKDFGWSEQVASDNYDYTIYNILRYIFRGSGIKFFDGNPVEQVVEINGFKVLFFHGNQIKGKAENKAQNIKGKYTARGIMIDFIVFGHVHSCRIGDTYARGSSMVGANAYSDSALQLEGRASQNIHILYSNKNRDSIKIDLQNVEGIEGYPIHKELEAYNAKSADKAKKKTIIHKIVV
ncbi:MAG: helix-turn-helix domain-containing protein [Candidatus Auribacterota bacterium]|nr:helix-turn-helix domain-containing protein [Candidatus Auribacterota bacterium]